MVEPVSKSEPKNSAAKPIAQGQARLILQDPLAFDQATQPSLRSSLELAANQSSGIEREKAREMWESLSLEPEQAQERQSERKRLLLRAETNAQEAAAAKAQALQLQAQLTKERDQRFHHPIVYAGAAGLLGLGALWWLERRKRLQLQERELAVLAQQTPTLFADEVPVEREFLRENNAIEELPHLASDFATDLSGLPGSPSYSEKVDRDHALGYFDPLTATDSATPAATHSALEHASLPGAGSTQTPTPVPQSKSEPISDSGELMRSPKEALTTPDWAQRPVVASSPAAFLPGANESVALSWKNKDSGLLSMSKRVLGNILKRKARRDSLHSSHLSSQSTVSLHHDSAGLSTQVLRYEDDHESAQLNFDHEAQFAFDQEMREQHLESIQVPAYDPDLANIDLLSKTKAIAQNGESAMEHLLELRTAVSGLAALGRPEGAAHLLEEHIAAEPATCAWAYLEYMNLCEQMQQRDDFEAMRKQYRLQFNRIAPYWHEPNSNVLGLDGYSRAASELCAAWTQGTKHAHQTLAAWLIGPMLGRKLVQLPAYHDLFELYEMLEFVEHEKSLEISAASGAKKNILGQRNPTDALLNSLDAAPIEIDEQDFVPTVSLLDLDYEFSSDVTLEEREVRQSEKAVTVVKTGNFSVDFNVAGTQMGSLVSTPADLGKK
jgi:hypothetical protein